jgi:hypothetical protein
MWLAIYILAGLALWACILGVLLGGFGSVPRTITTPHGILTETQYREAEILYDHGYSWPEAVRLARMYGRRL